jgi:hypothetical protein
MGAQGVKFPYGLMLILAWAGMFLSIVLPGVAAIGLLIAAAASFAMISAAAINMIRHGKDKPSRKPSGPRQRQRPDGSERL